MSYVLEHPEPKKCRGMPDARYVSYAYGRNDAPGYTRFTDRVGKAKTWQTRAGAERYLERYPNLKELGWKVSHRCVILPCPTCSDALRNIDTG